jgi:hypothetical protein
MPDTIPHGCADSFVKRLINILLHMHTDVARACRMGASYEHGCISGFVAEYRDGGNNGCALDHCVAFPDHSSAVEARLANDSSLLSRALATTNIVHFYDDVSRNLCGSFNHIKGMGHLELREYSNEARLLYTSADRNISYIVQLERVVRGGAGIIWQPRSIDALRLGAQTVCVDGNLPRGIRPATRAMIAKAVDSAGNMTANIATTLCQSSGAATPTYSTTSIEYSIAGNTTAAYYDVQARRDYAASADDFGDFILQGVIAIFALAMGAAFICSIMRLGRRLCKNQRHHRAVEVHDNRAATGDTLRSISYEPLLISLPPDVGIQHDYASINDFTSVPEVSAIAGGENGYLPPVEARSAGMPRSTTLSSFKSEASSLSPSASHSRGLLDRGDDAAVYYNASSGGARVQWRDEKHPYRSCAMVYCDHVEPVIEETVYDNPRSTVVVSGIAAHSGGDASRLGSPGLDGR